MDTDLDALLMSLIERWREKDFGLDFFMDSLKLVWLLWSMVRNDSPIYSAMETGETVGLMNDFYFELQGEKMPVQGAFSGQMASLLLKLLLSKLLEVLAESDLPEAFIEWVRGLLKSF